MLGLVIRELVNTKVLSLSEAIGKMTANPAKIFKLNGRGTLKKGSFADITIIDLNRKEIVKSENFFSKSKNSPFIGEELIGFPETTIVGGEIVWSSKDGIKP